MSAFAPREDKWNIALRLELHVSAYKRASIPIWIIPQLYIMSQSDSPTSDGNREIGYK